MIRFILHNGLMHTRDPFEIIREILAHVRVPIMQHLNRIHLDRFMEEQRMNFRLHNLPLLESVYCGSPHAYAILHYIGQRVFIITMIRIKCIIFCVSSVYKMHYNYESLFFPLTISLWFLYLNDKRIGFFLASIVLFFTFAFIYSDNYSEMTLIKIYLITVGSVLLFGNLLGYIKGNYDNAITNFVRLNIGCLILSIENNILLSSLLVIAAIMTPSFEKLKDMMIMKGKDWITSLWVILSTMALVWYYLYNPYFSEHQYVAIFCIILPALIHFYSGHYLESRSLILCAYLLFDLIDYKHRGV